MSSFLGKKSLNLRVWHWLSFVSIIGLMFTDIFRKTWFNKNDIADIVKTKLLELDFELSKQSATEIAKLIREPMWEWHYILGFLLVFLLFFRLFGFFILKEKNPVQKIKADNHLHTKMVKIAHLIFYIVTFYVCISGVVLFFRDDLGLSKESLSLVKQLHKYSFWFFLFFIVSHVAGVVKANNSSDKGLISEMFSGKNS